MALIINNEGWDSALHADLIYPLTAEWKRRAGWIAGPQTIANAIHQVWLESGRDEAFLRAQVGKVVTGAMPWKWMEACRLALKTRLAIPRRPATSAETTARIRAHRDHVKTHGQPPPDPKADVKPMTKADWAAMMKRIMGPAYEAKYNPEADIT